VNHVFWAGRAAGAVSAVAFAAYVLPVLIVTW
jgi:hypothetical protein